MPKKKKPPPFIKYGRIIIHIPYRYIRLIATLTAIYHICIMGYNVEMISIAAHIKGHIGDYLYIIIENGYEMVYVLCISSVSGILLNILITTVTLKMFTGVGKIFFWLLFASMVSCLVFMCIVVFLGFYMMGYAFSSNPDGIEGFYISMANYSNDGLTKTRLDIIQIELQCCGARNYTDWFAVEWYDTNFVKLNAQNIKLVGEVPFSCCNILTTYPCIHHGIESGINDYKYDVKNNFSLNADGCWNVMEKRKSKSGLSVASYLFLQFALILIGFLPIRLLQTASNEKHGFPLENFVYTAWIWGFYKEDKKGKDRGSIRSSYNKPTEISTSFMNRMSERKSHNIGKSSFVNRPSENAYMNRTSERRSYDIEKSSFANHPGTNKRSSNLQRTSDNKSQDIKSGSIYYSFSK